MKTPPDIGVAMLVADMFGVNRTPALKKIECPTLIIASAKSDELTRQQRPPTRFHARVSKKSTAQRTRCSSISRIALTNC